MFMRLEGFQKIDFIADDGNPIKGHQLFMTWDEDGVSGRMAGKQFVRDGMELPALTVGMTLDVEFNRKGKVVAIKAAAPAKS